MDLQRLGQRSLVVAPGSGEAEAPERTYPLTTTPDRSSSFLNTPSDWNTSARVDLLHEDCEAGHPSSCRVLVTK